MMKNIFKDKLAQTSVDYLWKFLSDRRKGHRDSMDNITMLAALLYLIKKDALVIKTNADWQKDKAYVQVDSNYIYMVSPETLSKWSEQGIETLDLCSILPIDDECYEFVDRNLSNLYNTGLSKNAIDIIKNAILGKLVVADYSPSITALSDYSLECPGASQSPKELAELTARIFNVRGKDVLDPFYGDLGFIRELDGYKRITNVEKLPQSYDFLRLFMALSDADTSSVEFIKSNCEQWIDQKYDAIVVNPPFGMKMKMEDGTVEDSTVIALKRFESTTTDEGQLFTYVPLSVLANLSNEKLREELVLKNYLDAVIMLPDNLLHKTSIAIAAIILKKNREKEQPVKMIDATEMYITSSGKRVLDVNAIYNAYQVESEKSISVPLSEIKENLFTFDAIQYCYNRTLVHREGFDILPLDKVIEPAQSTYRFTETSGKLLKLSTLPNDWYDFIIDVLKIEISDNLKNATKVAEPVILLSAVGKSIKMAYCEASEDCPVFIGSNINAYRLKEENIHIGYLFMELSKKFIPTTGITVPHISHHMLSVVKVDFPSLKEVSSYEQQKNLFEESKTACLMAKAKEMGLQEVISKLKSDYVDEIRARKHDMMPHLRQISSARKNLWYYLSHKEQFTEEEFLGGMREEVLNQEVAIESLTNLLAIFSRESQFGEPVVINLDKYLMENYFDGENYFVEFDTDHKALAEYGFDIPEVYLNFDYSKGLKAYRDACPDYIEGLNTFIAEDDLKRLCDNIIFNAIKHGFTDSSREDYSIDIRLSVDQKRDMFQIDFVNNGNPLPKGMDKMRYGLKGEKAGATAGTGEGGYIVKSITEHYGGDYDIFCETSGKDCITTVRVFLPIYRGDE